MPLLQGRTMRFQYYCVRTPSGPVHKVLFEAHHYNYKGVPVSSLGMPLLEAYEMVNEWNRTIPNYQYWLET